MHRDDMYGDSGFRNNAWSNVHLRRKLRYSLKVAQWNKTMNDELLRLRKSIDNIDAALLYLLAERFKITEAVGEYKAKTGLPPADPARESEQVSRLRRLAKDADINPEFSEKFLRFILAEVIRHHERIKNGP
jgi:chorismate mutase